MDQNGYRMVSECIVLNEVQFVAQSPLPMQIDFDTFQSVTIKNCSTMIHPAYDSSWVPYAYNDTLSIYKLHGAENFCFVIGSVLIESTLDIEQHSNLSHSHIDFYKNLLLEFRLKRVQDHALKLADQVSEEKKKCQTFADENYKLSEYKRKQTSSNRASNKKMKDTTISLQAEVDLLNNSLSQLRNNNLFDMDDPTNGDSTEAAYVKIIDKAIQQYKQFATVINTKISSTSSPTSKNYQFESTQGVWDDITDVVAITELARCKTSVDVTYKIKDHNYKVSFDSSVGHFIQENLDPRYKTKRIIRVAPTTSSIAASDTLTPLYDVLCGKTIWKMETPFINQILSDHKYDGSHRSDMNTDSLCNLGELFALIGGVKVTYDRRASKLFVKPAALRLWLSILESRNGWIRLGTHGSDSVAYKNIENDPLGFDLKYGGKHANAYGVGHYFGLTPEISPHYNKFRKSNSCLIALLNVNESIDLGGTKTYTPFQLYKSDTNKQTYNGISMHDPQNILVLGLLVE